MKKSQLVAALVLGASLGGAVQQANAYVYARSYLSIDNLKLAALTVDGDFAPVSLRSYVNTLTNTSSLNGASGGQVTELCTYVTCPVNTNPVLDADPSQIGSAFANNDFSFYGPDDSGEFARSDAVINTAAVIQIRDGVDPFLASSDLEAIAESQLQFGTDAQSQSQLQSTTGLTFQFSVNESGIFSLNFDAMWDLLADIDTDGVADGATAQAEITTTATLSSDNGSQAVSFTPGGLFGDCLAAGGTCVSTSAGDLNAQYGVSTDPNDDGDMGEGSFGFTYDGLTAGDWTLVLNTTVRTLLTQDIPVPATFALFGLGLTGMGFAARRRKRLAVA